MNLPTVSGGSYSYTNTIEFKGYDHRPMIDEGSFYDTQNISTRGYPQLVPRGKRKHIANLTNPQGMIAHEHLAWAANNKFWYNGVEITGITLTAGEKTLVTIGAFICILPDGIMYNTETGAIEEMANTVTTSGTVTASLCADDIGTAFASTPTVSDTAPADPDNGALWQDTSETPNVLKKWYEANGMWVAIETTYVKISGTGIGTGFEKYDGVTISGMTDATLNGDFYLAGVGTGYIVLTAIISAAVSQTDAVTVSRKLPTLDYACVQDNRIWGCSSDDHEIYACALGDPKNWNKYLGIASDSYAMTVGSAGDFTGCISYQGYVYFFKEDRILKIFGTKPENYQLSELVARGAQSGSEKSLVVANETLYYKAPHGFCVCDGGMPYDCSDALGDVLYKNAVAGVRGKRYYVSMEDDSSTWHMMVLDVATGFWAREDNTHVLYFAALGEELYFVNAAGELWSVGGTSEITVEGTTAMEGNISFEAISGDIGLTLPYNKYVKRLVVRAEIKSGGSLSIYTQYDEDVDWTLAKTYAAAGYRLFKVPIIPHRADRMRIKIAGVGDIRVFAISKIVEGGSENNGGQY